MWNNSLRFRINYRGITLYCGNYSQNFLQNWKEHQKVANRVSLCEMFFFLNFFNVFWKLTCAWTLCMWAVMESCCSLCLKTQVLLFTTHWWTLRMQIYLDGWNNEKLITFIFEFDMWIANNLQLKRLLQSLYSLCSVEN